MTGQVSRRHVALVATGRTRVARLAFVHVAAAPPGEAPNQQPPGTRPRRPRTRGSAWIRRSRPTSARCRNRRRGSASALSSRLPFPGIAPAHGKEGVTTDGSLLPSGAGPLRRHRRLSCRPTRGATSKPVLTVATTATSIGCAGRHARGPKETHSGGDFSPGWNSKRHWWTSPASAATSPLLLPDWPSSHPSWATQRCPSSSGAVASSTPSAALAAPGGPAVSTPTNSTALRSSPLAILGSDTVRNWKWLEFPRVTVQWGEPPVRVVERPSCERRQLVADYILDRIRELHAELERLGHRGALRDGCRRDRVARRRHAVA